jgi:thymidylate synthase (FAD)
MKVKLISYSQPSQEILEAGIDDVSDLIAFSARVSNPANQLNTETADKLIKYLVKHKHWSPLELVSVCIEVETTRDIARQFLRHRSFSFQEFSQRYADPTQDLDFVIREARLQDTKNRQNSVEVEDKDLQRWWEDEQRRLIYMIKNSYNEAIKKGIAKEQARVILPEGNTVSRMYVNGTLRSWVHYCELRSSNGTQKEHIEIARACAEVITKIFPLIEEYTTWQ